MKFFIFSFFIITNSFAATLNCEQKTGWETQDLYVKAQTSSEIEIISEKEVNLKNFKVEYSLIYDLNEPNSVWSQGSSFESIIPNMENYNPRKYKNHMKFSMSVSNGTSEGYGYLDLIVPTETLINLDDSKEFKSYLIMSWMDDHFGGTALLNCKIIK